jgi:hypothetical protein
MNLAFGEHFGVGGHFMGKEESLELIISPSKKRLVGVSSVVVP